MRFLVDENLPADLATMLEQLGHDAIAVIDSSLRASDDETIWRAAATENRILVTQDLDFPLNTRPRPSGLVLVRLGTAFDVDGLLRRLRGFFIDQGENSLEGQLTVVEPARTRSREF